MYVILLSLNDNKNVISKDCRHIRLGFSSSILLIFLLVTNTQTQRVTGLYHVIIISCYVMLCYVMSDYVLILIII